MNGDHTYDCKCGIGPNYCLLPQCNTIIQNLELQCGLLCFAAYMSEDKRWSHLSTSYSYLDEKAPQVITNGFIYLEYIGSCFGIPIPCLEGVGTDLY